MEIWEIDKNLKVETTITEPDLVWFDVKEEPFALYGIQYDAGRGRYLRMPYEIAESVSAGVLSCSLSTAGGRVRFCTDSPYIAIRAVMDNRTLMSHIPLTGQSGFDLYRVKDGKDTYFRTFVPPMGMKEGYSSGVFTDHKEYQYTIHFPLYDRVKELYIALKKNAHIKPAAAYKEVPPVVYYGSSITQGGCASRPGNAYENIISRRLNVDHINLGFSGSARGEENMVNYLASMKMSVFVCDYDHNAPNAAHLANTLPNLYRKVRAAQPNLPYIFASSTDSLLKGDEMPWSEEFAIRREVVRKVYEEAVAAGDKLVRFVDGKELFAGECWDDCTVDGTHPNDLGFFRMAMGFEKAIKEFI